MSDFGSLIPLLSLLIPIASLGVAILTYLRVSKRYIAKTLHFNKTIRAGEESTIFCVKGDGVSQRLEIEAVGNCDAKITFILDGEVCLRETFGTLYKKSSRLLTQFLLGTEGNGHFAMEMDCQRNFCRSLELFIDNKTESISFHVKGTVQYDLFENRFRWHKPKKAPTVNSPALSA